MDVFDRVRLVRYTPVWLCVAFSIVIGLPDARSQGFRWPDEPKNIQVLPKTATGAELGRIMRSFNGALGVRCENCHVGQPGADMSSLDFVADSNPKKEVTRAMIRMTQEINDRFLTQAVTGGEQKVQVTCMTCHRRASKPRMVEDILAGVIEADGVDAAIRRYRRLRTQYYGGFTYDFSAGMLTNLAERMEELGKRDVALRVLALETEQYPEYHSAYVALGNIQAKAGDREAAIQSLEKALQYAPANFKGFIQSRLENLKKQ